MIIIMEVPKKTGHLRLGACNLQSLNLNPKKRPWVTHLMGALQNGVGRVLVSFSRLGVNISRGVLNQSTVEYLTLGKQLSGIQDSNYFPQK